MKSDRSTVDFNAMFPHQVCINLDRRLDRWKRMQERLSKHGIANVVRESAFDSAQFGVPHSWESEAGAYGCLQSHLKVLVDAKARGLDHIMIWEDDVILADGINQRFAQNLRHIPADWDVLVLGALHAAEPEHIAGDIYRITKSFSSFAFVVRHTIFDDFIKIHQTGNRPVDHHAIELQRRRNFYSFLPHLAWVEDDPSDIREESVDYWYIKESLVVLGKGVDAALSRATLIFAFKNTGQSKMSDTYLLFLINTYRETLPNLPILVVEQGTKPTLSKDRLPSGCQYYFLKIEGDFDRQRCWKTGLDLVLDKEFVVFSDPNVYLQRLDICGNVRVCERYDVVTGFSQLLGSEKEAFQQLDQADPHKRIGLRKLGSTVLPRNSGACLFMRRRVAQQMSESWGNDFDTMIRSESYRESGKFSVFESPNLAIRLPFESAP
ncbi:MAG: hypothetical protein GKR95_16380 [Gammaproteobacteria bacterium]|nr:hypothetical protein [Gammaproteobacteria bacterium]